MWDKQEAANFIIGIWLTVLGALNLTTWVTLSLAFKVVFTEVCVSEKWREVGVVLELP